jgi:AcrR family transcriptional regulator
MNEHHSFKRKAKMSRKADPARRDEILKAARAVFQEHGYEAANMAQIAALADCAVGTLYLLFDSKADLALALGDEYMNQLAETFSPALAYPDPRRALAEAIHLALAYSAENVDLLRISSLNIDLAEPQSLQIRPQRQELERQLAEWLVKRMALGQIRRYDPAILARAIWGLIKATCETCLLRGTGSLVRYESTLLRMIEQSLLAGQNENLV